MPDLTLIEKLRQLEACKKPGDPMPPFLADANNNWLERVAAIAKEAADALEHDPISTPFGWFEPIVPSPGGSLVERFSKGPTKPLGWSDWAFAVYAMQAPSFKHARSKP